MWIYFGLRGRDAANHVPLSCHRFLCSPIRFQFTVQVFHSQFITSPESSPSCPHNSPSNQTADGHGRDQWNNVLLTIYTWPIGMVRRWCSALWHNIPDHECASVRLPYIWSPIEMELFLNNLIQFLPSQIPAQLLSPPADVHWRW